jgi:hypothetical protein
MNTGEAISFIKKCLMNNLVPFVVYTNKLELIRHPYSRDFINDQIVLLLEAQEHEKDILKVLRLIDKVFGVAEKRKLRLNIGIVTYSHTRDLLMQVDSEIERFYDVVKRFEEIQRERSINEFLTVK